MMLPEGANQEVLAYASGHVQGKSELKLDCWMVRRVNDREARVYGTPDPDTGEVQDYRVTRAQDRAGVWHLSCECAYCSYYPTRLCSHKAAYLKAIDDPSRFASDYEADQLADARAAEEAAALAELEEIFRLG